MKIRQASLLDESAIFRFLDRAYPGRAGFKHPQRWKWAYRNNPFLAGQVPVWIAVTAEGEVVGQSAALVEPLVVGGVETRVGWGVDFHVLPAYRGRGLGTRLQAANKEFHQVFMSLSMAQGAAAIKSALGMRALPAVPVFTRILHHEPDSVAKTLSARLPFLPLRVVVGMELHLRLASLLTARDARKLERLADDRPAGIDVQPIQVFGADSDQLWEQVGPQYAALVRRDAAYLNWKFVEQPHMQHQKWLAYRAGAPCGHLVVRRARPPERNAGILADLFVDPSDTEAARALLLHALDWFAGQEVAYVQAAGSTPALQNLFGWAGFRRTSSTVPMAGSAIPLPETGWLLGKGDHDWDQYPLA